MGPNSVTALASQLSSRISLATTVDKDSKRQEENKQQVNNTISSATTKSSSHQSQIRPYVNNKPTMAALRTGQPTHHEAKGKIINKLALVLLSIVILELVLIGDQVQPVKAIKKKIFLKKLKKMLPLLALIKPKKKIILLPIPIPMQMMKQSHFGGRYPMPSGPSLIMPMGQMDMSQQQHPMKPQTNNYDMTPSAPMMMSTLFPVSDNGVGSSAAGNSVGGDVLSMLPPPAGSTMQMLAPPTTMTMTITAGGGEVSSAPPALSATSGGMMVPPAPSSLPLLSAHNQNHHANLLSYQAAQASVQPHGDPSGELYYSSPYGSGGSGNKNTNINNMPNISQLQSKIQSNNNNNNHARLRSPVHYGQQQQHHNRYRQPSYDISAIQQQQHHHHQQQQQQQQMPMHEIEMEFSPSAPIQQHHQHSLKQQQQQMIPFYPSDSESSQSYNSVVHLPVLHNSNNHYSGKLNNNEQQLQQLRESEPTKSSLPAALKSPPPVTKQVIGGGY